MGLVLAPRNWLNFEPRFCTRVSFSLIVSRGGGCEEVANPNPCFKNPCFKFLLFNNLLPAFPRGSTCFVPRADFEHKTKRPRGSPGRSLALPVFDQLWNKEGEM